MQKTINGADLWSVNYAMDEKYTFAVLTMSDKGSRGEREDTSGAYLQERLAEEGYILQSYQVIPDNKQMISRESYRPGR